MKSKKRCPVWPVPFGTARLLCCAALVAAWAPAHAGWLDGLLGQNSSTVSATSGDPKQRLWRLHEFTTIALVPRESGARENQQPVVLQVDVLRQQLALLQFTDRGTRRPLFAADEVADLAAPLAQALGRAGPADDIVLLSSSRRDAGILGAPTAVTARLFVQAGELQFIVHDARFEFFDAYRGTHIEPRFSFGSRVAAGAVAVQSSAAPTQPRADWLSIPLASPAVAAPAATAGPAPTAAPAAVVAPAAPVALPAPRKALDAAGAEDIERRLETLKRLRDKSLITEDEYQQKRKDILQLL